MKDANPVVDHVEAELVPDEPVALTTRPAQQLEGSMPSLGSLAVLDEGLAILKRKAELEETITLCLIRVTEPEDWVRSKSRDGQISALPTKSATTKMARFIGLEIAPIPPATDLTPELVLRGGGKVRGFLVHFQAQAKSLGVPWRRLETTRWEDEGFAGRQTDQEGVNFVFKDGKALESDLRSAARTAAMNKGVREITGLGKVPDALLLRAWGNDKALARCQQGHGFGSSEARSSQRVAEEGVGEKAKALWEEILRLPRISGDESAGLAILRDITSYPAGKNKSGNSYDAFPGVKNWQAINSNRTLEGARRKLAEHPMAQGDVGQ